MQKYASTYTDLASAQRSVDCVIGRAKNQAKIDAWLRGGAMRVLPLVGTIPGTAIGRVMSRTDAAAGLNPRASNDAKAVLKADARSSAGYKVLTSYPILPPSVAGLDEKYPCLFQLVGGYFHQDWYDEYRGTPQAALDDYVAASTRSELEEAGAEIDSLLATSGDDDLTQLLVELDNNFVYEENDGYTARTWLKAIRTCLR